MTELILNYKSFSYEFGMTDRHLSMKYKGRLEEMIIDSEDAAIDLSGSRKNREDKLVWIDLAPLAECKNLKALNLEERLENSYS